MARRFIRYKELLERDIVHSRTDVARRIKNDNFPAPYEFGPNSIAWDADEVEQWLSSRRRRRPKISENRKSSPATGESASQVAEASDLYPSPVEIATKAEGCP